MSIEVNNESGVVVDELAVQSMARFVLDSLGINPLAELSILLVDIEAMSTLHKQWMDLDGPTDVMAFPMDALEDKPGLESSGPMPALLGDVIVCPQIAEQQAEVAGHRLDSEIFLLTTHGLLHLLGYDHDTVEEEAEMFGLQSELLAGWSEREGRERVKSPIPGTSGLQRS